MNDFASLLLEYHQHHHHHTIRLTWCKHSSASGARYKVSVTHVVRRSGKTDTSSTQYGMMRRLTRLTLRSYSLWITWLRSCKVEIPVFEFRKVVHQQIWGEVVILSNFCSSTVHLRMHEWKNFNIGPHLTNLKVVRRYWSLSNSKYTLSSRSTTKSPTGGVLLPGK